MNKNNNILYFVMIVLESVALFLFLGSPFSDGRHDSYTFDISSEGDCLVARTTLTDEEHVKKIKAGEIIQITGLPEEYLGEYWVPMAFCGYKGYVKADDIDDLKASGCYTQVYEDEDDIIFVSSDKGAAVYKDFVDGKPQNKESDILEYGTQMIVTAMNAGWLYVEVIDNEITGWIDANCTLNYKAPAYKFWRKVPEDVGVRTEPNDTSDLRSQRIPLGSIYTIKSFSHGYGHVDAYNGWARLSLTLPTAKPDH